MSGHTPGRLMELATDFGVESLRLGSYESRKGFVGAWKVLEVREKREAARAKLKTEVDAVFSERDELLAALDKANASRIAAQTENEALKAERAASGVAERRAVRDAVLAEREACAKVCHNEGIYQQSQEGNAIMADKCWFLRDEIRARAAIAKVEP